jgi:hypothetical protein
MNQRFKGASLLFLATLAGLAACTEVSFPTHQPKGEPILKEFPKELQGRYATSDVDSLRDTLIIDSHSYRFLSDGREGSQDWLNNAILSDSLVLKKYKGLYFVNFREGNQWLLRIVKRESNGNLLFRMMAAGGTRKDKFLFELQQELPVEVVELSNGDQFYRIDPTPKKLMRLLRKKQYLEESTLLRLK